MQFNMHAVPAPDARAEDQASESTQSRRRSLDLLSRLTGD